VETAIRPPKILSLETESVTSPCPPVDQTKDTDRQQNENNP